VSRWDPDFSLQYNALMMDVQLVRAREMSRGNPRLFYRAWRERYGKTGMLFTSALREVNMTRQDAMNWEEAEVDKIANDQYGLNMIPGGFKGLRYLLKRKALSWTAI